MRDIFDRFKRIRGTLSLEQQEAIVRLIAFDEDLVRRSIGIPQESKEMNVKDLQVWLNAHGASPKLVEDGIGGTLTRTAFIQVFINKNAKAITKEELQSIAVLLGDTSTKRVEAVASVESNGGGWFNSGLPKILYERHYFYRLTKKTVKWLSFGWLGNSSSGGYTTDVNSNGINDNWEKLAAAVCIDPDSAIQSVSIGKFQVMGSHYKLLGYSQPIDMLWAARNDEYEHYKMLANYILKVANLKSAFLKLSTNPSDNVAFARGYNGPSYSKNAYDVKLARAMR